MNDLILKTRLRALHQNLSLVENPSSIPLNCQNSQCQFRWTQTIIDQDIWLRLIGEINRRIEDNRESITRVLDRLDQATNLPDADRKKVVADAWTEYAELNEASREIFCEYLDLIGGVAFREKSAVLDANKLCQVADEMIRSCSKVLFLSPSLTVPAHGTTLAVTVGRILRLPYSEWTVWALPLVAHEFGHVALHDLRNDPINRTLHQLTDNVLPDLLPFAPENKARQKLDEYLADAFGTFIMGPAYVCAAIHLRLNPAYHSSPGAVDHTDCERAHVMLSMLQKMDNGTGISHEYEYILKLLKTIWSQMVYAANRVAEPGNSALAEGQLASLDRVVEAIWKGFKKDLIGKPMYSHNDNSKGWLVSRKWGKDWSDVLKKVPNGAEAPPLDLPGVTADSMLSDALNAGWYARLEHPARTNTIQTSMSGLCSKIIKARRNSGAGSSQPVNWKQGNEP
jgi:hypothetical protein